MSAYKKLLAHSKKIAHFQHLAAITGWDQAAVMPTGGASARSDAMAELSLHIHQLSTQPQLGEWLHEAETEDLDTTQQAIVREMKQEWLDATLLPDDLVTAKSLAGSRCEHAWREQRPNNDWHGFAKNWQEVVKLSQEEAHIRAEHFQCTPYDAMLNKFEPGTTTADLDGVFDDVKSWLPNMIEQAIEKQSCESVIQPQGRYPTHIQKSIGLDVMKLLQFDFNHGRLDESVHPFCGGVPTDVRITTRYDENEFVQAIMGIVHETGHARYEQGLPRALAGLRAGQARSMGVHESQSLFFEMQLGRNPHFIQHIARLSDGRFDNQPVGLFAVENLQKLYTRVKKDFIRVDADELTYPAHIILRYEIERDLMNGLITVNDVPELWNEKMQQYLGLSTQGNDRMGCMQDIHWTDGAFGYFPSYTLGAMYAAQFMATMRQSIDIETVLDSGDLSPIFAWLADNIWQKGSVYTTNALLTQATGETLNPAFFKAHLQQRYL